MKSLSNIIAIFLTIILLQGCADGINKQTGGALIGGGLGALVGSRFGKGTGALVATGLGAVAGGFLGSQIGQQMDERDRQMAELAQRNALETSRDNQSIAWNNPNTGHYGSVTPSRTYQQGGRYCREYCNTVTINGKKQRAYGTACRCPDGSWEIIK